MGCVLLRQNFALLTPNVALLKSMDCVLGIKFEFIFSHTLGVKICLETRSKGNRDELRSASYIYMSTSRSYKWQVR